MDYKNAPRWVNVVVLLGSKLDGFCHDLPYRFKLHLRWSLLDKFCSCDHCKKRREQNLQEPKLNHWWELFTR
jgi:hypothetical protein